MAKLTQREYLGRWNFHTFRLKGTNDLRYVECSNEEYQSMGGIDGFLNNPDNIGGWEWVGSTGGAIKIATGDYMFGAWDYSIVGDEELPYFVCYVDEEGRTLIGSYSEEDFLKLYGDCL